MQYNVDDNNFPMNPSGGGGLNGGNPRIYYDDEGRVQQHSSSQKLLNMLHWRPTNIATAVETADTGARPWRFMPWSEREKISPLESAPPSSSGIVTRRYDDHPSLPGLEYKDYSVARTNSQKYTVAAPSEKEALIIDEMKVYDDPPILLWLFIIDGLAMILLGILTSLWCLSWDQMYYSRFWVGLSLIVFGIVGYIHRGDYLTKWKSVLTIVVGVITIAFVMASTAMVLQVFCHRLIEVAQFSDWTAYLQEMLFRIKWLNDYPSQNLTTLAFPDANIRACFAMDGIMVVLDIIGFLTVTTTALVIDKFYNSHYVITRQVEPFCQPKLFNPFGQVSLGQAQMFIGFVLQSSVYGNYSIAWQNIFAPVFSGVVPVIAGIFAALSLKSCGINHRCWNFVAVVLEIVSIIISIVAIVLVTIGMVQNIQTLQDTVVMTYTTFSRQLMVSSIFIFCVSDIVCIVNIFYSAALLIRMLMCICCSKNNDLTIIHQHVHDNDGFHEELSDNKGFREMEKHIVK